MKEAREFEAATVEEAVEAAARELGVSVENVEYEVAESASRGILGMGSRRARIVVMVETGEDGREADDQVEQETSFANQILEFQTSMIQGMQLELRAEAESTEEYLKLELSGPDRDIVLQSRAELLEAFQYLLNRTFSKNAGGVRILVDCDGFRQKKEEELKQIAKRISDRVRMTGQSEELGMMNPYERRIVHLAVAEEEGVTSESAGSSFLKRVVILPS